MPPSDGGASPTTTALITYSPNGGLFLDPILSPCLLHTFSPLLLSSSKSRVSNTRGIFVISKGSTFSSLTVKGKTTSYSPGRGAAINNSSKHLWAGAVTAMLARFLFIDFSEA